MAAKRALVTGAASGMGRATAHLFADEGAHVAVTDINSEGVAVVVAEIKGAGLSAEGWTLDLVDGEATKTVVAEVAERFGGLDILINNAGLSQHTKIDDDGYEEIWDRLLSILLSSHTRTIRAALPYLRASEGGRIVNIASTDGLRFRDNGASIGYTMSKHALVAMTHAARQFGYADGVRATALCPGAVDTDLLAGGVETPPEL